MKHPDDLSARLRAFYGEQRMPPAFRAALLDQVDPAPARPPQARRGHRWGPRPLAWLTVAVLATVALALLANHQGRRGNTRAIAEEIALNHRKQLDVEVATDRLERLQAAMPKLDFTLAASAHPHLAGLDLLGARYCSIGPAVAAQLRLQDAQGRLYTLYQLPIPDQRLLAEATLHIPPQPQAAPATLASEQPAVKVLLWQEHDLLFGLATADKGTRPE